MYCPTPTEAQQILAVRKLLEAEAARLAAIHVTEAELTMMETFLQKEKQYYMQNEELKALKIISDFHMAIINASRNNYLIRYLKELVNLTHIILTFYDTIEAASTHSPGEHKAIFEAIKNRDSNFAYQLAYEHVDSIQADIDFSRQLKHTFSIEQVISRYRQHFIDR
ncbi:FCD domain-containing protein [Aneurinibacillus tyrosinisolvens]|uniref:FCD domain-containing protein n=1 Tax=Aneurinibacillus tyrosinisolvens TaxID=1443435 RepID=UPI000A4CFF6E|nr:FCD domain-containing protein [Aneurinibacillus tyrosinisolvens]